IVIEQYNYLVPDPNNDQSSTVSSRNSTDSTGTPSPGRSRKGLDLDRGEQRLGVANQVVEAERVGGSDELVQPVEHETADRVITGLVTAVPFLLLSVAAWQVWNEALHWRDLAILGAVYLVTGLGITVGFHRLFTHRSFQT